MYAPNNLYKIYKERVFHYEFSSLLPDITKKTTLDNINFAINLCQNWNSSLDVGCGDGHYSVALASKFKKAVGIEMDKWPEHAELVRRFPNIEIINDSIENYQTKEKFDFILLSDIFEHIPNITTFIQKISSLQESAGVVYILTPNPIFVGPASESEISFAKAKYHGHIKHYSQKEVVDLMQDGSYYMEFFLYEETPKRQIIKRVVKGISRRDLRWSNLSFYRLIRPFVIFLLEPFYYLAEIICSKIERRNNSNPFNTRAQVIVFKKR